MTDETDELSKTLRQVVKRGNLTHLSIISSDGIFKAVYRGVDEGKDYRFADGLDIVDVIMEAVTGRKQKNTECVKPVRRRVRDPYADKPTSSVLDQFEDLLG